MNMLDLNGFKELDAALGQIEKQTTRRSVAIRSLTVAAEPMRATIERLAPRDKGTLHKSIAIAPRAAKGLGRKTKRGGSGGEFGDEVEVFIGLDTAADPAVNIYGPSSEFGFGHQPLDPFFRPGYDAEVVPTIARIGAALKADIEKTAARAARKKARG